MSSESYGSEMASDADEQNSEDLVSTVIFDIGTHSCKLGYASSNFPEVNLPSVIGMPKYNGKISSDLCQKDEIYVGMEAINRCPTLSLKHPIE